MIYTNKPPDDKLKIIFERYLSIAKLKSKINPSIPSNKFALPLFTKKSDLDHLESDLLNIYSAQIKLYHYQNDFIQNYQKFISKLLYKDNIYGTDRGDKAIHFDKRNIFGRPDLIFSKNGPKLLETNFDTGIAGFDLAHDYFEMAKYTLGETNVSGSPFQKLAAYFEIRFGQLFSHVLWITTTSKSRQILSDYWMTQLNKFKVNLTHCTLHPGEPFDFSRINKGQTKAILHRSCSIYTLEAMKDKVRSDLDKCLDHLKLSIDQNYSIFCSKFYLAFLSQLSNAPGAFSNCEQLSIARLIPWTRIVHLLDEDELSKVKRNKTNYVLKKCESYRSKDVFFGSDFSDLQWSTLILEKIEDSKNYEATGSAWITQEKIESLVTPTFRAVEYNL